MTIQACILNIFSGMIPIVRAMTPMEHKVSIHRVSYLGFSSLQNYAHTRILTTVKKSNRISLNLPDESIETEVLGLHVGFQRVERMMKHVGHS